MDENETAEKTDIPLGKTAKSLPAQLADLLLAEVMTGRIKPGDRLKEESLAHQHAVSRATVRETLIALEKQGYVVRVPRSGARIAEFSQEDIGYLYEIRAALLGVAAGRCAQTRDEDIMAQLLRIVETLEAIAADAASSPLEFATYSMRAQNALMRWSGNQRLPELYERLAGMGMWQLVRGRAVSFLTPENRKESAADWRSVAEAIAASDQPEAEKYARRLLEHSARRVNVNFAKMKSTADDAAE